MAPGESRITGFLPSQDCIATLNAFTAMGVTYQEPSPQHLVIQGVGTSGLQEPEDLLDMGNSGTGTRLLMGVLAGQSFCATLTGDSSLRKRPMARVAGPLRDMGAIILGRDGDNKLPLSVRGGQLKPIGYTTPVASAQIKSAILLAGLFADGVTSVTEHGPSRDHTERMLTSFGVELDQKPGYVAIEGGQPLIPRDLEVPGDISSAAFFIVAASIVPESDLIIENIGINPTRTGIIDVLAKMGARIAYQNQRFMGNEPVADIHVQSAQLQGVTVSGDEVVRMIDEFPVFAVAAAFAEGGSTVKDAEELRVKESDRISVIVQELGKMGVTIDERPDGFSVEGGQAVQGAHCLSHGDHRIAMSLAVAALNAQGETRIQGTAPVATSFPGFAALLNDLAPGSIHEEDHA